MIKNILTHFKELRKKNLLKSTQQLKVEARLAHDPWALTAYEKQVMAMRRMGIPNRKEKRLQKRSKIRSRTLRKSFKKKFGSSAGKRKTGIHPVSSPKHIFQDLRERKAK